MVEPTEELRDDRLPLCAGCVAEPPLDVLQLHGVVHGEVKEPEAGGDGSTRCLPTTQMQILEIGLSGQVVVGVGSVEHGDPQPDNLLEGVVVNAGQGGHLPQVAPHKVPLLVFRPS